MMTTQSGSITRMHLVRMANGEDILEGLSAFALKAGIVHAAILSGVGSVKSVHTHVVRSTEIPPGNTFTRIEGPFDIITLSGGILDGRVHAHIELAGSNGSFGGHLEPGTVALTFCLVFVAELDGIDLTLLDKYPIPGNEIR